MKMEIKKLAAENIDDFQSFLSEQFAAYDQEKGLAGKKNERQLAFEICQEGRFAAGLTAFCYGDRVQVNSLFVAKAARDQGLGSALMDEVERWGKSHGYTSLDVTTLTVFAPKFYQARGYQEFDRIKNAPIDGVDTIRYKKNL